MKKIAAAMLCCIVAASASIPVSAQIKTTDDVSGSGEFSWYLDPCVEADDMTVLYNYQGGSDPNDGAYFYNTIDRMHLGEYTPFEKDGKWGLIDYKGNAALTPQYDKLATCADCDSFVGVNKKTIMDRVVYTGETNLYEENGTFLAAQYYDGMLGTNGKIQRAFYWLADENRASPGGFQADAGVYSLDGLTFCAQLGKKNYAGAIYILSESGKIMDPDNPDMVLVSDGKRVNDEYYVDAGCYSEGLIAVYKNEMWGYLNEKGETIIPFDLDATSTVDYSYSLDLYREIPYEASNGYVSVCMGGSYALYDTSGNVVIDYDVFDKILPVYYNGKDKLAWVKLKGSWGVIRINENSGEDTSDTETDTDTQTDTYTDTQTDTDTDTDTQTDTDTNTDTDTEKTSKYRKGDVNRDRYITAKDSFLASRYAVGLFKLDDEQFALADIDGDGRVTNKDALYILRFTIGIKVKGM